MPTDEIQSALEQVQNYIQDIVEGIGTFWGTIQSLLCVCLVIVSAVACVNIIVSLVKAVIIDRASWKKAQDSELMYSYAAGSGQFQRKLIRDVHKFLLDKNGHYSVLLALLIDLAIAKTYQREYCFCIL